MGELAVRHGCMLDRDQRILTTPDDERGKQFREVQPVVRAHPLAAEVEHRAQAVDEGLPSAGIGQRAVAARHFREVGAGAQPHAAKHAAKRPT